jgi:hypothetical protein
MAGMVFRKDPKPDDVSDQLEELFTDVDMCGNSFWSWNVDAFQAFLRDGNGFIYVDSPPLKEEVKAKIDAGQKPTRKDRQGDRPFWVFYEASQVINHRYEKDGPREVLAQVTIEESAMEPDGEFGEKEVVRHLILRRGSWETLVQNSDKEFVHEKGGQTGLADIPLIPISDFDNAPPLLTLAMLNRLHYNQTSDFDSICHLACTPTRVQKFDSKEDADKPPRRCRPHRPASG